MQKLHYSIFIAVSPEKVWHTMLDDASYRIWTAEFNPAGSWYVGEWVAGSHIAFIGASEDGKEDCGMVARVAEVRPFEYVSIQHVGELVDGQEKLWDASKYPDGVFENYTLIAKDGGTEVVIDMDSEESYVEMFQDMWPRALQKLKELAEVGE